MILYIICKEGNSVVKFCWNILEKIAVVNTKWLNLWQACSGSSKHKWLSILINTGIYAKSGTGMWKIARDRESYFRKRCVVERRTEITEHFWKGVADCKSWGFGWESLLLINSYYNNKFTCFCWFVNVWYHWDCLVYYNYKPNSICKMRNCMLPAHIVPFNPFRWTA